MHNDGVEPEIVLREISALFTAPFRNHSEDVLEDTSAFESMCPHCFMMGSHMFVSKGFLRKHEYCCLTCSDRTSKCVRFQYCGNATKSNFLWDDAFCESCDRSIQRAAAGDVDLEKVFLESSDNNNQSVGCSASVDAVSIWNGDYKSSASVQEGDSFVCRTPMSNQIIDPVCHQSHRPFEPTHDQPACADQVEPDHCEIIENANKPWCTIYCALVHWPGEDRVHIDRYRHLWCHRAWIERWIRSCGGDQAWTMRRILAHFRWRQKFRVDTIMDEVNCPGHIGQDHPPPFSRPHFGRHPITAALPAAPVAHCRARKVIRCVPGARAARPFYSIPPPIPPQ
mmetsp:Transcript_61392/g.164904  ORF Transcript_61392/g.164904 Transcript_61392/m.164904 type:complete len:339 (-) Transcript_61392:531-1547(-)